MKNLDLLMKSFGILMMATLEFKIFSYFLRERKRNLKEQIEKCKVRR